MLTVCACVVRVPARDYPALHKATKRSESSVHVVVCGTKILISRHTRPGRSEKHVCVDFA